MASNDLHPNDVSSDSRPKVNPNLVFRENLLKGQTAQHVVEQLFAAHDYTILPFGVETRFPVWSYNRALELSEAYKQVRAAPDFIAECPTGDDSSRLYHLEVKFRANGRLRRSEMEKYQSFPDTIVVLVGIGSIKANFLKDYLDGQRLKPISQFSPLRLNAAIVKEFERMAEGLFRWTEREAKAEISENRRSAAPAQDMQRAVAPYHSKH